MERVLGKFSSPGNTRSRHIEVPLLSVSFWVNVVDFFGNLSERRRERMMLAAMDDRMLSDIGLSRVDAEAEISKPFRR
jgi:uncharacterized protein YjiS (DUF1127 family)